MLKRLRKLFAPATTTQPTIPIPEQSVLEKQYELLETKYIALQKELQVAHQTIEALNGKLAAQTQEHTQFVARTLDNLGNASHGMHGSIQGLSSAVLALENIIEDTAEGDKTVNNVPDSTRRSAIQRMDSIKGHLNNIIIVNTQQTQARDRMLPAFKASSSASRTTLDTGPMPRKILIVDDQLINRTLALKQLKPGGHLLETASNGQEAMQKWQSAIAEGKPFDAILMDVTMPVMDGLEATRGIRHMESVCDRTPVYIIGLSANADPKSTLDALESGMNIYLTKPCAKETLLASIAKVPHTITPSTLTPNTLPII
jgi:CheY-like chemotaxis protein